MFTQCERQFLENHTISEFRTFLNGQLALFNTGCRVCVDYDVLKPINTFHPHCVAVVDEDEEFPSPNVLLASKTKLLGDADSAGSIIDYRCVKCRGCIDCKERGSKR